MGTAAANLTKTVPSPGCYELGTVEPSVYRPPNTVYNRTRKLRVGW